jgi:hypothetical protein
MAVHGDIKELNVSHPDLGNIRFFPIANQGNTLDTGGLRNEIDITSNAGLIVKKNRIPGELVCMVENDQNVRNDAVNASNLSESSKLATWTVSMGNGAVWQGLGTISGEIKPDVNTGQMTLTVHSGLWQKIQG